MSAFVYEKSHVCASLLLFETFAAEYLGFNNRTCSTALSPKTTSGPVMRGPSESMMWREWLIQVLEDGNQSKKISLQAYVHPDVEKQAKCLGFVSTFYDNPKYKGTCAIPPYGTRLFLNASQDQSVDSSQVWTIRSVGVAEGEFELLASNKPDACQRLLAVEDCESQPAQIFDETTLGITSSAKFRSWKLVKRYDIVPKSLPPPPPALPPPALPPPPPASVPGPVISAPSVTTLPYVNVLVLQPGGNQRCSVTSIVITSAASSIGSTSQTVEVSSSRPNLSSTGVTVQLDQTGYNSIYAVGKCSSGEATERSNGLSVLYSPGTAPQTGSIVLFTLRYLGLTASSFNQADRNLVCTNIGSLQPGGTCQILSVVAGSAVVTGTVDCPSQQDATSLAQLLKSPSASSTLTAGSWNSATPSGGSPSGVVTEVADIVVSVPSPPPAPPPPPPLFYLASNGVTVKCPNAAFGDTGTVNSITYTKRTKAEINTTNAETTCTSGVTDMSKMFQTLLGRSGDSTTFNQDIGSWDVSQVTDMSYMFNNALSFNQNINAWDTSLVQNMEAVFLYAQNFAGQVDGWNTSSVTSMKLMFAGAALFNSPIGSWNVENVVDMQGMFASATSFSSPLNTWNPGRVTTIKEMFRNSNYNLDLNGWDTSSVTDMDSVFRGASKFNAAIGTWDTSKVETMKFMFELADDFNQPIGNWITGAVKDMSFMFYGTKAFDQDIGGWDTQVVTTMERMFENSVIFNQNLTSWCVGSVTNSNSFATCSQFSSSLWPRFGCSGCPNCSYPPPDPPPV